MKYFAILGSAVTICGLLAVQPVWADALGLPSDLPKFLLHSSQGYLGVDLAEAKVPHAAEIVMVDHDAPASKRDSRSTTSFCSWTERPSTMWSSCARSCASCPPDVPSAC